MHRIQVVHKNHPQPQPLKVPGKIVFHGTSSWCPKCWFKRWGHANLHACHILLLRSFLPPSLTPPPHLPQIINLMIVGNCLQLSNSRGLQDWDELKKTEGLFIQELAEHTELHFKTFFKKMKRMVLYLAINRSLN